MEWAADLVIKETPEVLVVKVATIDLTLTNRGLRVLCQEWEAQWEVWEVWDLVPSLKDDQWVTHQWVVLLEGPLAKEVHLPLTYSEMEIL